MRRPPGPIGAGRRRPPRAGRPRRPEPARVHHSDGDFSCAAPDLTRGGRRRYQPSGARLHGRRGHPEGVRRPAGAWGTVGTAATWDLGTPAQLREEIRERIRTLGRAGLLVSPAYDLDFVPRENIEAFVQAAREFG